MNTIKETPKWTPRWRVLKHRSEDVREVRHEDGTVSHEYLADPLEVVNVEGNALLNEGITELLTLLIGDPATAFSNGNSYLGVGNSTTAALATQTALQGTKTYKGMENGYPSVNAQTVTFRSIFGSADANYAWEEFSVANGSDDATAENLNRKVQSAGTKASGQTWTLDLQITLS